MSVGFSVNLSFREKKRITVLPIEFHLQAQALFGRNRNDLQAKDFTVLFAKFDEWFTEHFAQLEKTINTLPTTIKKIKKFELMRQHVETSTCYKGATEICAIVEKIIAFLDYHNHTHFPIVAELLSLMSSFLEKFEDNTNVAFQPLHQTILLRAHRLSSYLCLCTTNRADKINSKAPKEAKVLYQTASTFGELCIDYQNSLSEFPSHTSNNAVVKLTTQTLAYLSKCYIHKGEYSLAIETLHEMHAHYNKFSIEDLANVALILNGCQNLNSILMDKMEREGKSTDVLEILQKSLRLSKRYLKFLEGNAHKLTSKLMATVELIKEVNSNRIDADIATKNYFIIVMVDILKDALIKDNAVLVTLPPSMPHGLIEREIRRLKMIENQPPLFAWHSDTFSFVIENALDIDLDSLRLFNTRIKDVITKFNSSEAQRLQRQNKMKKVQVPLPEAKPATPMVSAALPIVLSPTVSTALPVVESPTVTAAVAVSIEDPEVESLMVKFADELSIHKELPATGSLIASPSLLSTST